MTLSLDAATRVRTAPAALTIALAIGALVTALLALDTRLLNDGDTFWHIRAGEWMLDHRAIPHTDMFSFTRAGAPWATHEWLAEIVMALAYRAGGFAALMALTALAVGAAAALMGYWLQRRLSILAALTALALALACAAPNLLARPHVLALPILVFWAGALFDARAAGRAPTLALAPAMTVWANMHGGYMIGIALIAPLALEALLAKADRAVLAAWARFAVAAVAAALLTPSGVDGLLFPFALTGEAVLSFVGEWRAPNFSVFQPIEAALVVGLFAVIGRGVKISPARLALLLALLHMALTHQRHGLVFGLIGAMALADPLSSAFPRRAPRAHDASWPGALGVLIAAILALRLAFPVAAPERLTNPASAIAAVPPALRAMPVFNAYPFGGALIFAGVKPYVDSRVDVYGGAFLTAFDAAIQGDERVGARLFAAHDIQWTMLEPASPLVRALDGDPRWRRLYADEIAVVHTRAAPR